MTMLMVGADESVGGREMTILKKNMAKVMMMLLMKIMTTINGRFQ